MFSKKLQGCKLEGLKVSSWKLPNTNYQDIEALKKVYYKNHV